MLLKTDSSLLLKFEGINIKIKFEGMSIKIKLWIVNHLYFSIVGIILIFYYIVAGSNPDNAKRVLQENGFSNITVGGYAWSREGWNQTKFIATNCAGKPVHGYVGYFFSKSGSNIVIQH